MRDQGCTFRAIAIALGKSESGVRHIFEPKRRLAPRPHAVVYPEVHAPRKIRAVLPPRAVLSDAVRCFARGEIDRAELSRVLHSEDGRRP